MRDDEDAWRSSRPRKSELEGAQRRPGARNASDGAPPPHPRPRELEAVPPQRRARSPSRRPTEAERRESREAPAARRGATGRRTSKQLIGRAAENIAAEFLRAQGLEILERNYLRRLGELDIVARDPGGVLVIAEVRARASERFGGAAASVNFRKQQRLIRAAHQLLQQRPHLARSPVRFDVICVSDMAAEHPRVDWIRQAFLT